MPFPTTSVQNTSNNVVVAFDVLIEEIESALHCVNTAGASAFETNDYEGAHKALEYARRMLTLRQNIFSLKEEWDGVERTVSTCEKKKTSNATPVMRQIRTRTSSPKPHRIAYDESPTPMGRLIAGRIRKGLRTPEPAFFRPILQALSDLGGSAKRRDVFDLLEQSMRDVLKPVDYQTLSSEAGQSRWQNSAQWAHNLMVKEGLLRAGSPQGIWEITEKGRTFLTKDMH